MSAHIETPSISKHDAARALVDATSLSAHFGAPAALELVRRAEQRAHSQVLGDGPRWLQAIATLRARGPTELQLDRAAPRFSPSADLDDGMSPADEVEATLLQLSPWRKGPFEVLGTLVDAEWRSDMKWARLQAAVNFAGRRVLDVGSGNGYSVLRALGAGASAALGVDPTWLYVAQFAALRALSVGAAPLAQPKLAGWVLPLTLEDLAGVPLQADVVLAMGVLYHRKSPIDHLERLRSVVTKTGVLVLETLVVPGDARTVLVPQDRYAAMRNVWMIPSVDALYVWLRRCGFSKVELIDVSVTTEQEQRATVFMPSLSLADFLDTRDPQLTKEGHPRPRRALLTARVA